MYDEEFRRRVATDPRKSGEIERAYRIGSGTISLWRKEFGIPPRKRQQSPKKQIGQRNTPYDDGRIITVKEWYEELVARASKCGQLAPSKCKRDLR